MLRGLRNASSSWVGKTVMAVVVGVLVLAFGVWGIGDIFRGFGRSTFAKIGGTEISIEQFRQSYNDRLQQVGRELRRPMTATQAHELGIESQLVSQLVAETAIDEKARQMGLRLSDEEVGRLIMNDPGFRGPSGPRWRPRSPRVPRVRLETSPAVQQADMGPFKTRAYGAICGWHCEQHGQSKVRDSDARKRPGV